MKLSRNQRKRLLIVTSLGLVLVGGVLALKPQWDAYSEKQLLLEAAAAKKAAEAKPRPVTLAELTLKLERLKDELRQRGATFPVAENVSLLLMQVEELATRNIEIESFIPTATGSVAVMRNAETPSVPVEEQRIELVAKGDFNALHKLLAAIETYQYPLGVQAIQLEREAASPVAQTDSPDAPAPAQGPETLKLRMQLSAYLLSKSLDDSGLLGDPFAQLHPLALEGAGVLNPFRELEIEPTPGPPPTPPPPPPPPAEPVAPLQGWKLEGVLFGPGHEAIVSNGAMSLNLRVGDLLEDWTVTRIEPNAITLTRDGRKKRLTLPETF